MGKKLTRVSNPRHLITRILEEPGVVATLQSFDAGTLGKLIEHVGLEDSGELLSLMTPEQLKQVLDLDLWRAEQPGREESFDAERFATWLEVLLEMGAPYAARKLAELDEDFLTLALSEHVWVIDIDALALRMSSGPSDDQLEKALESGLNQEFEEFRVISRNVRSWDAILTVLVELDSQHHELLRSLLERCHTISNEFIEDNGGLYQVLTAGEQVHVDVADEREQRRAKEGYVSPATASSFLGLIRITPLEEIVGAERYDTVTQGYFRDFVEPKRAPQSFAPGGGALLQLLQDAGVLEQAPRVSLLAGTAEDSEGACAQVRSALRAASSDAGLRGKRMGELNYLANILVAGCSYQDRAFRPAEAIEAVLAIANLGLETFRARNPIALEQALMQQDLVKMFRIGWRRLYEDVSLRGARTLLQALPTLGSGGDAWIRQQLTGLGAALRKFLEAGEPWRAHSRMDVLGTILSLPEVEWLRRVLDEVPSDRGFISTAAQVERVQARLVEVLDSCRRG